jgi:hypothetical protein
MDPKSINPDARSLEEEFFAKQNAHLLEQLREKYKTEERREALRSVVQIQDDGLLDRLIDLGIGPETILALTLVPLAAVAWADGEMDDRERRAILKAAEERGVSPDSPGRQLLESWLDTKPSPRLLEVWKKYVCAIWEEFSEDERREMRRRSLDRAREVAEAAGGFLGLTSKISPAEQAVIEELESVLS